MSEKVSIGILAVQRAFAEHQAMIDGLGADTFLIRQKKDLVLAIPLQPVSVRAGILPTFLAASIIGCAR